MKAIRLCLSAIIFVACHSHIASAQDYKPHPWRPPFGLDRVGVVLPNADVSKLPDFEADALPQVDEAVNPVDVGAILVPADWLLLTENQNVELELAALSRKPGTIQARAVAWYSSNKNETASLPLELESQKVTRAKMKLPHPHEPPDEDVLNVTIQNSAGAILWKKDIHVMFAKGVPGWLPQFGATRTWLRYDAPISVREADGSFSQLDYEQAWDPTLQDVVVWLPNGSRFVFWRGSSYIPFWAGKYNTGLSYEWAETSPPPDGFVDCVEPLMDKELRYSRVEIVESTVARVHVRWTYQSCDFQYKVWGDSATEDFYFYPDGFGTRVLTLQSALDSDYELSEFIILTPQSTYPLSILPANLVKILFLDGESRDLTFPFRTEEQGDKLQSRDVPMVYRVRLHKDDPSTAVYFHPQELKPPPVVFAAFEDRGETVTPCYWGSHWPLARGQTTGGAINDRVHFTPCHNSVMSWARQRPPALREAQFPAIDTLGRAKPMRVQTWAWLIGMTDESDERVREWVRSFSAPPSINVRGATLAAEPFVPERRAIRLITEEPLVQIQLTPNTICVNPVFEINTLGSPQEIRIGKKPLAKESWQWDGATLWINATFREPTELELDFGR